MLVANKKIENTPDSNALYAFFDFAVCPPTFDFLNFICMANAAMISEGYDSFKVVIIPGSVEGFRSKTFYSSDHKRFRVRNIILQAIASHPNCSGYYYLHDRKAGEFLYDDVKDRVFPWGYDARDPVGYYNWGASVEMLNAGYVLPSLEGTPEARREAQAWLSNHCGERKPIIITLRESPYEPKRNSNLKAWCDFADSLDKDEYCVVFIRDHDASLDATPAELSPYLICREAPWNLAFRTALYELAYLAFFVNNGPWLLGILNPNVNSVITNMIVEDYTVSSSSWFRKMGMLPDQLDPFWGPLQSIVWHSDDLDVLAESFANAVNKIENLFDEKFDESWYLSAYPSVQGEIEHSALPAIEHYKQYSGERCYNPNAWFDELSYRNAVPGLQKAIETGVFRNGFEHYLTRNTSVSRAWPLAMASISPRH